MTDDSFNSFMLRMNVWMYRVSSNNACMCNFDNWHRVSKNMFIYKRSFYSPVGNGVPCGSCNVCYDLSVHNEIIPSSHSSNYHNEKLTIIDYSDRDNKNITKQCLMKRRFLLFNLTGKTDNDMSNIVSTKYWRNYCLLQSLLIPHH